MTQQGSLSCDNKLTPGKGGLLLPLFFLLLFIMKRSIQGLFKFWVHTDVLWGV